LAMKGIGALLGGKLGGKLRKGKAYRKPPGRLSAGGRAAAKGGGWLSWGKWALAALLPKSPLLLTLFLSGATPGGGDPKNSDRAKRIREAFAKHKDNWGQYLAQNPDLFGSMGKYNKYMAQHPDLRGPAETMGRSAQTNMEAARINKEAAIMNRQNAQIGQAYPLPPSPQPQVTQLNPSAEAVP